MLNNSVRLVGLLVIGGCAGGTSAITVKLEAENPETFRFVDRTSGDGLSAGILAFEDAYGNRVIELAPQLSSFLPWPIQHWQFFDRSDQLWVLDTTEPVDMTMSITLTGSPDKPIRYTGQVAGNMASAGVTAPFTAEFVYALGGCRERNPVGCGAWVDDALVGEGRYEVQNASIFGQPAGVTDVALLGQFFTAEQIAVPEFPIVYKDGVVTFGAGVEIACVKIQENVERGALMFCDGVFDMTIDGCDYDVFASVDVGVFMRLSARPIDDACGSLQDVYLFHTSQAGNPDDFGSPGRG